MNKTFPITCRLLIGISPILLTVLFASTISAQSPCGETVTVAYGDTLSKIAKRCNTTVPAILEANPDIANPNVIYTGMKLRMPTSGEPAREAPVPSTSQYHVSIEPTSGPPGTKVQLTASGFPPNTEVLIGAGRWRSEYDIIDRARTDAEGSVSTETTVPMYADSGEKWVFVVTMEDRRVDATSAVFTVHQPSAAPEKPAESSMRDDEQRTVEVRGTLTDEGVECPVLRSDDGKLYTLTGNLQDFQPGDRVFVRGTIAEMSFCMQGTTLVVKQIEKR